MGRSKKAWTKEAHERAYNRLLKNLDKPVSYVKDKERVANMTDDFKRY